MRRHLFSATTILLSTALIVPATAGEIAVSGQIGTPGIGVGVKAEVFPRIGVRLGYDYLALELDDEEFDDVTYDVDADFSAFTLAVDFHPFANGFNMSAGISQGDRGFDLSGMPSSSVEIGDIVLTPTEVGTLIGEAEWASTAPYLGIGWDSSITRDARWHFIARAGVLLLDEPDVELRSEGGLLSSDPTVQAEIEQEEQSLQEDLDDYSLYPVLSLGVAYQF